MLDALQIATGIDVPCEELGITIHQPKIKDIAILGETNYFLALQIFRLNTDTLKVTTPGASDWDIFNKAITEKIDGIKNTRALVRNFIQLFLLDKLTIGPRSLILDTSNGMVNIEPEQFRIFQNIISQVAGAELLKADEADEFKPKNKKAAEIAEKIKKARAKVAKIKAAEMGLKQDEHKGFIAKYMKIAEIGTANSIEDINNMTLLQLNTLVQTYFAWESYDLDIKSRLAGAKNDKKLVHWSMADEVHTNGFETI